MITKPTPVIIDGVGIIAMPDEIGKISCPMCHFNNAPMCPEEPFDCSKDECYFIKAPEADPKSKPTN